MAINQWFMKLAPPERPDKSSLESGISTKILAGDRHFCRTDMTMRRNARIYYKNYIKINAAIPTLFSFQDRIFGSAAMCLTSVGLVRLNAGFACTTARSSA